MPIDKFILIGQTAVPCDNLMEWARWMEQADRTVFRTKVGDWEVSTVFLGLDHNFSRVMTGEGEPILYETMCFYRRETEFESRKMSMIERIEWRKAIESTLSEKELELTYYQTRYHDWSEAEEGHERAVRVTEQTAGLNREPSVDPVLKVEE